MRYRFECEACGTTEQIQRSIHDGPGGPRACACGGVLEHVIEAPRFICRGTDPDHVPERFRVTENMAFGDSKAAGARKERAYQRHVEGMRKAIRDGRSARKAKPHCAMGVPTHSIPAELYWGKIRETGDQKYWDDPKNRDKHKSTKVS